MGQGPKAEPEPVPTQPQLMEAARVPAIALRPRHVTLRTVRVSNHMTDLGIKVFIEDIMVIKKKFVEIVLNIYHINFFGCYIFC